MGNLPGKQNVMILANIYIVVSVCFLKCVNACEHVLHLQVISTN
jgi:hypothetical protein